MIRVWFISLKICGNPLGGAFMSLRAPLQELSDDELVQGFQSTRDQACFCALFERHRRKVYLACTGFFHEPSAAEDATQETFLRAFQNVGRFASGDFTGWIMRIARNVCIDQWRRRRHEVELEGQADAIPDERNFERSAALRLTARQVLEEMAGLPGDQRCCLELKIDGYSYEETASLTGFTIGAVKSHLQNGRRALWLKLGKTVAELK